MTDKRQEQGADPQGSDGASDAPPHAPARRIRRRRFGGALSALSLLLVLLTLVIGVGLSALALTGRALTLPVWAVAEIEARVNARIPPGHLPPGTALSLGAVDLGLERDFSPRLHLRDLRLVEPKGTSLLSLPEVRVTLAPGALLLGQPRPQSLRLSGASMALARDRTGRLSLRLAGLSGAAQPQSAAEVLAAIHRMFATPALADLALIEAEGLTLVLDDARAGRQWALGDGRLVIQNRAEGLAAELALTLLAGDRPAQARLALETSKSDSAARIFATVDHVQARDLADQAAPLAFLGLLDAPISGRLVGGLDGNGQIAGFSADLRLDAGSLTPGPAEAPVPFDAAELSLRYDPARQRVTLEQLAVESASLKIRATGTADLVDAAGAPVTPGVLPEATVVQLAFSEVMVDPEGLFEVPARFSGGAASVRIWRAPFRAEIGEVSLFDGAEHLTLSGQVGVAAGGGWQGAVDVALNRIGTDRLIKLWPVSVVPKTRDWLAQNVGQGELLGVAAALRFAPGGPPRFALDYEFEGAEVRVVRSLPPVKDGQGRSSIKDNVYTVVVESGHVTPPQGGDITVDGTLFRVPDITEKPARAEVRLITDAPLTATLSLLDQDPFRFISKAGRAVDLGQGRAVMVSDLRFPLVARVTPDQVEYTVSGRVLDFRSDSLVAGKVIASPDLAVKVTKSGMTVSGAGDFSGLPVVARYEQPFGKESGGTARLTGSARITDARLRGIGITLPQGWLTGETGAEISLDLPKGAPAELRLTSDLAGAGLGIAPLSWSKGPGAGGRLELSASLGPLPEITDLQLEAAGLLATGGQITLDKAGLKRAAFARLQVGRWLDAPVEIIGRGPGAQPAIRLTGGRVTLATLPPGGAGGGTGGTGGRTEIEVNLDRLQVTETMALTGLAGRFLLRDGGLDGSFVAAVNGTGRVAGATMPYRGGTAVRITADDAGRVMAAAGIFSKGQGGALDLTIQPRGAAGNYYGVAKFTDLSLQGAPALAALLSAASVVGLLNQLNGQGIVFNEGDVEFLIQPAGVQITRGAAIGASMGISFAGVYRAATQAIDIQGTISPLYLLNGVGEIFGRRGEGLFGFNYRMSGAVSSPQVSVNPLSILTPGMFRDIFRRAPPKLESGG